MIPPSVVRNASSRITGITSNSRLLSTICKREGPLINTGSYQQILTRVPVTYCQSRRSKIEWLAQKNVHKEDVSYFDEFYAAVKKEVDTVGKDPTLNKWQKLSDDPEAKQRALNKWVFLQVTDIYVQKNKVNRRGHCEFIKVALKRMKEMGLEREISCYKALFRVFPQHTMQVSNVWEAMMAHYPKQQSVGQEIMDHMSDNGVIPDGEFSELVLDTFGLQSPTFKKVRRMLYWMPKFQHLNPYKLPHHLPGDQVELALLALKKMAIDIHNENTVWKINDEGLNNKETFAASAQSPEQRELLHKHPVDVPLYVEGAYLVWLRQKPITYFILKAEADEKMFDEPTPEKQEEEELKVDEIETMFDSEESGAALAPVTSQHHQPDGTVFAMCVTGTSTKDSLIAWVRRLQETNPNLEKTPIVFTLRTPEEDSLVVTEDDKKDVAKQT